MYDRMILIDKPAGMTSFSVVARVRRVLSKAAGRKIKVGHTGTLDPFATGLLILMAGKYTKRCQEFLKLDKRYTATIRLGATSTTGDVEGEIHEVVTKGTTCPGRVPRARLHGARALMLGSDLRIARESSPLSHAAALRTPFEKGFIDFASVQSVVKSFEGEIRQRVPAFSAVKIGGVRAYKLARKGEKVEMPERTVTIYEINIIDYKWPYLKIDAKVSSGTYIRTLGEDIGEKLGVGGYLTELVRTEIGEYKLEDAIPLEDFMKNEELLLEQS